MKYKILTKEEIQSYAGKAYQMDGIEYIRRPFFHGTREYALTCPRKELKEFMDAANTVMQYIHDNIRKLNDEDVQKYRRGNIVNGIHSLFGSTTVYLYRTAKNYEYGSFYLTTGFDRAVSYSYNCGGELGENAYHNALGIRDFGMEVDEKTNEAIDIVIREYPKFQSSPRIVLFVDEVPAKNLSSERGGKLSTVKDEDKLKRIVQRIYEECESDTCSFVSSFRVTHKNDLEFKAIMQEDFIDGYKSFTRIEDLHHRFTKDRGLVNINNEFLLSLLK